MRILPGPENAVFWRLSALRAHTKTPYKTDLLWETLRPLKRPGRARTVAAPVHPGDTKRLVARRRPQRVWLRPGRRRQRNWQRRRRRRGDDDDGALPSVLLDPVRSFRGADAHTLAHAAAAAARLPVRLRRDQAIDFVALGPHGARKLEN